MTRRHLLWNLLIFRPGEKMKRFAGGHSNGLVPAGISAGGKLLFRYPAEKIVLLRLLVSMPTIRIRWSAIWRKPQHQEVYRQQSRQSLPGEWAQTAAIGIALRNAGFGLQFAIAGEEVENIPSELPAEIQPAATVVPTSTAEAVSEPAPDNPPEEEDV